MTRQGARTIDQFCEDSSIGRTTAYKLAREGKLRLVKVGKKTLVLDEDAAAFFRSLQAGSATDASEAGRKRLSARRNAA